MRAAASWQAGRLVLTALLLWRVATALRRRRRHCALDAARRLRGGHAARARQLTLSLALALALTLTLSLTLT